MNRPTESRGVPHQHRQPRGGGVGNARTFILDQVLCAFSAKYEVALQDLEVFHANIASHAATEPAMRAAMAARRAVTKRRESELGLEYGWRFERLRQRVDGENVYGDPAAGHLPIASKAPQGGDEPGALQTFEPQVDQLLHRQRLYEGNI